MDYENVKTTLDEYLNQSEQSPAELLSLLQQYIAENFEGKTIAMISELESESHQSYKYLYENVSKKIDELTEEAFTANTKIQQYQKEIADLTAELNNLKNSGSDFKESADSLMKFIRDFLDKDIIMSEAMIVDDDNKKEVKLSLRPGVYQGHRPSYFTSLKDELNKENISKKNVKNTSGGFLERFNFVKKISNMGGSAENKADYIDVTRRENVKMLLDSSISNEEKYLKYFMLTPGLSREYIKTLNGCSELGLDANLIIELLEQPVENFNREILEAYVSKAHKGLEYDFKQELAEELLNGKWYISAIVNGKKEKFELAPLELIMSVKNYLETVYKALESGGVSFLNGNNSNDTDSDTEHSNSNSASSETDNDFENLWESELNNQFEQDINIDNSGNDADIPEGFDVDDDTSFEKDAYM